MKHYFDSSFGFICVLHERNGVRYGLGPVVPFDASTIHEQRYQQFKHWIEVEPHRIPDEWLIAFAGKPKKPSRVQPIQPIQPIQPGKRYLKTRIVLFAILVYHFLKIIWPG
jgi:hypothetical protein